MAELSCWTGTKSPCVAVHWTWEPAQWVWLRRGFVFYGEPTAENIRAIQVKDLPSPAALKMAKQSTVPSEAEVVALHEALMTETAGLRLPPWKSRQGNEPMDEFLQRVARMYELIEELHPYARTTRLADHCGVPFTTAVYWIRQCRTRGFLKVVNG